MSADRKSNIPIFPLRNLLYSVQDNPCNGKEPLLNESFAVLLPKKVSPYRRVGDYS